MKNKEFISGMAKQLFFTYWSLGASIFSNLMYGTLLLVHNDRLFSAYIFPTFIAPYVIPKILGLVFILIGFLIFIAWRMKSKRFKSIILGVNNGLWTMYGLLFFVSVPPNSIWVMAILIFLINLDVAARE